jgi:hypothetical protein
MQEYKAKERKEAVQYKQCTTARAKLTKKGRNKHTGQGLIVVDETYRQVGCRLEKELTDVTNTHMIKSSIYTLRAPCSLLPFLSFRFLYLGHSNRTGLTASSRLSHCPD